MASSSSVLTASTATVNNRGLFQSMPADSYLTEQWQEQTTTSNVNIIPQPRKRRWNLNQSRLIPWFLWIPLCYTLGIPSHAPVRPILPTILYMMLASSSLVYAFTWSFYTYFYFQNPESKMTLFVLVCPFVVGIFWCTIGVYAFNLAYNVLTCASLVDSVRLHGRTLLKMNIGLLSSLLMIACVGMLLYQKSVLITEPHIECDKASLPAAVCVIQYCSLAVYSILSAFFNLIVLNIVVSIARTQTITVRRFIRELDFDAKVFDRIYQLKRQQQITRNSSNGAILRCHVNSDAQLLTPSNIQRHFSPETDTQIRRDEVTRRKLGRSKVQEMTEDFIYRRSTDQSNSLQGSINPSNGDHNTEENKVSNSQYNPSFIECQSVAGGDVDVNIHRPQIETARLEDDDAIDDSPSDLFVQLENDEADISEYERLTLSHDDISNRFWKISQRLMTTSLVFQRWLLSWVLFVCFWSVSYIIFWLGANVASIDVLLFFLPIAGFVILCSAYAEVNNECILVSGSVYPSAERISLVRMIDARPMRIGVFNIALTYTLLFSVILALSVALISRIIMDIIKK